MINHIFIGIRKWFPRIALVIGSCWLFILIAIDHPQYAIGLFTGLLPLLPFLLWARIAKKQLRELQSQNEALGDALALRLANEARELLERRGEILRDCRRGARRKDSSIIKQREK